jgi:hypothetical protein
MAMKIMNILERRNEALLISIDVDGAFDRVWWDGLVKKLKARGMRGRALR